jgi:hypothetical protein
LLTSPLELIVELSKRNRLPRPGWGEGRQVAVTKAFASPASSTRTLEAGMGDDRWPLTVNPGRLARPEVDRRLRPGLERQGVGPLQAQHAPDRSFRHGFASEVKRLWSAFCSNKIEVETPTCRAFGRATSSMESCPVSGRV